MSEWLEGRPARGPLTRGQRRTLLLMALGVAGLHLVGFATLLALTAFTHSRLAAGGAFTVGIGLTAYSLGLRHAFDADHIAAIDNTTRRLMSTGERPLSTGFWFSLGHSTVVFVLAFLVALGIRTVEGSVTRPQSGLHQVASLVGTLISGGFLYLIAAINLAMLLGMIRLCRAMRTGSYTDAEFHTHLNNGGLMNRVLGRRNSAVRSPRGMYPIGVLFGLGFDTATEVALLVLASGAAGAGLPWYAILCLPVLFAGGMVLMDTVDGVLMNLAYGWAFLQPVRKMYYNLIVTGLSVALAVLIGTIELGGLIASQLKLSGAFWSWFEGININALGFAIVAMFAATWLIALLIWRWARLDERWSASVKPQR